MKKIEKVVIKRIPDYDADTSTLGKYTDDADDWNIDRQHGEYIAVLSKKEDYELPTRGREFRYFKPCAGEEKPGTADYQKYGKQDYERMEALNSGDWNYIGIRAYAETSVKIGDCWKIDELSSGGLWGIESDSDESYFKEVGKEELGQLRSILKEYGFTKSQIDKAFKDVKEIDE